MLPVLTMTHFLCVCPQFNDARTRAGRIFSEGVSAAIEIELEEEWDCHWETQLRKTGLPLWQIGGGQELGLCKGHGGGIEDMIPEGVLDLGKKRQLTMLGKCVLRMDNYAGNVEMQAIKKEEKYHSACVVLRAGLRLERGLGWHAGHLSFIAGWKTTINKSAWAENLTQLGIPTVRH
eukprot:541667-Rhodomonas_salina.1